MERRLAAILAADVVDYSRLMGEDQDGTLAALKSMRADLLGPSTVRHSGRLIKSMGDGWLVEFPSIAGAVASAIEMQTDLVDHDRIKLRVGIHIGDVSFDDEDVFGDGVNIAARLEEIARPGEVLISDTAHHSLDGKIAGQFSGGGQQQLKNISRPVAVWRWSEQAVSIPAKLDTPLPLPDKPSIAVLPFDNMSGDPEQEYFSNGISEDVITDLSKFGWLTVIPRNSSFSYKGRNMDLRALAGELGARYVLEGSVRTAGNRIRITAQLIDADEGGHLWAERYNRELSDIFDLQDEMTQAITSAIGPNLEVHEIRRALGKRPESLDNWDRIKRAHAGAASFERKQILEAIALCETVLESDPDNLEALGVLALGRSFSGLSGWGATPKEEAKKAILLAGRALRGDPSNVNALIGRAYGECLSGDFERSINTARQVLENNPNDWTGHIILTHVLTYAGDYDEAVRYAEAGTALSRGGVHMSSLFHANCLAYYGAERYGEAVSWCEKLIRQYPKFPITHIYAPALVGDGHVDRAGEVVAQFLRDAPRVTIGLMLELLPARDPAYRKRYGAALKKAGMPE